MKTAIKTIALAVTVLLSSCSKDNPEPETSGEKTFKVEVQYTGNIDKFEETLVLQVATSKASTMKIVEHDFAKEIPSGDVVWFTKPNGAIKSNATYTTSEKGSVITVSGVITPVDFNSETPQTVSATIKFYADGKLRETKTLTSKSDIASTPFSFPVTAN